MRLTGELKSYGGLWTRAARDVRETRSTAISSGWIAVFFGERGLMPGRFIPGGC